MNKVEEVARAICARRFGVAEYDTWDTIGGIDREEFMKDARAAIEAMREPTDGIENAITRVNSLTRSEVVGLTEAGEMWGAAIDAALTDGGE